MEAGGVPPVAPTNREGEVTPTREEMWQQIENYLAEKIRPALEDARAAGEADALRKKTPE
jgi:hypothetical protein